MSRIQKLPGALWVLLYIVHVGWVHSAQLSGDVASDLTILRRDGPLQISRSLRVLSGATLSLEPGVRLEFAPGASLIVEHGGRLFAEGTPSAPVLFTRAAGTSTRWGGLVFQGNGPSPDSVVRHARFEFNDFTAIHVNGGSLTLDYAEFAATDRPYLSLDGASFLISHCHFPSTTGAFEPLHGTGGVKPGGRGIVRGCFFGSTLGYNDIFDFTGGKRTGGPILEMYDNVFTGATDDILDLDGTDAWIEGNLFMHCHRNGSPDSASAVSGGDSGGVTSAITILGNIFFDCDNAATAKEGNFFTLLHNTIVKTTRAGGMDTDSGVVNVRDTVPLLTAAGRGFYLEGNIIYDAEKLVRNLDPALSEVRFVRNLLPEAWPGLGERNEVGNPRFRHVPTLAETRFTNWSDAQILRDWLDLSPDSPALRKGIGGRNLGAMVSFKPLLSGAPERYSLNRSARITVGLVLAGKGIPLDAWPSGSGYTHFRWRLDGGVWSSAIKDGTPIALDALTDGSHVVEVSGIRDSGTAQNAEELGENAMMTISEPWQVTSKAFFASVASLAEGVLLEIGIPASSSWFVESADSLAAPVWDPLDSLPKSEAASVRRVMDPRGRAGTRFYRLRDLPGLP